MMRTLALSALVAVSAGPCLAATAPAPVCTTMEKAQKAVGKGTTAMVMNRAQFHFLQGLYAGLPTTPEGLPPGDGAVILLHDKGGEGIILWTRARMVCDPLPLARTEKLLKMLSDVKAGGTGYGEDL